MLHKGIKNSCSNFAPGSTFQRSQKKLRVIKCENGRQKLHSVFSTKKTGVTLFYKTCVRRIKKIQKKATFVG